MKEMVFVQGLSELFQIMDYSLLWVYHILGCNDAIENRSADNNVNLFAFVSSSSCYFLSTFIVDPETFLLLGTIPCVSVKKDVARGFFPLFRTFLGKDRSDTHVVFTRDHCDHMQ